MIPDSKWGYKRYQNIDGLLPIFQERELKYGAPKHRLPYGKNHYEI